MTALSTQPATTSRSRWYLARHWSGDHSLARSYWVNGFLLSFTAVIVLASTAISLAQVWGIIAVVAVWQITGIWRSALKHKSRGGKTFWAGLAFISVISVILGFLGLASISYIIYVASLNGPGYRILENGDMEFDGKFGGNPILAASAGFGAFMRANPNASMIHLTSNGGSIAEAKWFQELIAARGMSTYVSTNCASACTIAFMGGRQRYMAPGARLGFHGVDGDPEPFNSDLRHGLIALGVEPWFAAKTTSDTMWWPSTQELLDAKVITGVCWRRIGDDSDLLHSQWPDCP